jgi:hypothetical protein
VYLSGLDHEAHVNGLSGYKNYFTETVDVQIKSIVATLKGFDEFDNKMFIIVSDHGETQMPVDLKYEKTEESIDIEGYALPIPNLIELPIDMSCSLKTNMDNEDVQLSESANNNIHIWELGEIFYNAGDIMSDDSMNFSVMAPQEIANQYDQYSYGAKPNTATANIIAALNGPIAHIYLKNRFTNSWSTPRIVKDIGYVAEILRLSISTNKTPSNLSNIFPVGIIEDDVPILSNIDRLTNSVDFILVRRNNNYEVFYGIKPDGSDILSAPLDNYAEFGSFLYAKALKRIANMNHPERSGDIVLVMRDFANGDAINRFTTAYACKAWHGSLNPSDSYVPLVIAYPGGNNSETDKLLQSVSACSNGQCEGNWNVTEIIKTIIDSQYVTP